MTMIEDNKSQPDEKEMLKNCFEFYFIEKLG